MTIDPPLARTIGALMAELADRFGDRPALSFDGNDLTFREFYERSAAWSKALLALGISRGDRVAVLAGNHPDWLFTAIAAARIGAVLAPMNTWYKDEELHFALQHSEAQVLLCVDRLRKSDYAACLQRVAPDLGKPRRGAEIAAPELPALRHLVELRGPRLASGHSLNAFLTRADDISDVELEKAEAQVGPGDDLFYLYTSGSTAQPKCVPIQHGRLIENNYNIGERQDLTPGDRTFLATPLFYGLAAVHALFASWTHATCVVLQEVFEPGAALDIIEQQRCTVYYGFGDLSRSLTRHPSFPERELLLTKGFVGITSDDKRHAVYELGVRRGTTIYGLTESYGPCIMTHAGDPEDVLLQTSGTALPGWDIRITDPETGQPTLPGNVGQVEIKGYVMEGYVKQANLTHCAFTEDGYFRTGDLAWFDESDRMVFHSRSTEMIKTRGINVSPLEVEKVLEGIEGVLQAHVVGIPDEERGEVIVAFIEADPEQLPATAVRAWVSERAASYKVPTHVLYRSDDALPRVASGKVPRRLLREQAISEVADQR